ncbi:MAG: DUF6441 family protein [Alphaproteobacteria bacterium]
MQLKLAIEGKLSEFLDVSYKQGASAVTKGISSATDGLKSSMRTQVKSAGLSPRLANTWRGVIYPKSKKSISAAGVVYSNAQKIMEGFEYQTVIRGKSGFWLAIPTSTTPKRIRGKKMTPKLYEQAKNVKLRFVYRRGNVSLLVHEYKKKTVIAFLLVPQVKMPKLITFETEGKHWQDKLPNLILQNWRDDE